LYDDGSGGAALSGYSWITFDGTTLTVSPDNPNLVGTHSLLGTFTATNGSPAQFTVATITVDCVVTGFTKPANPSSGLAYNLWASPLSFDFSLDWVQAPACGHIFTDAFTWTGLNSYVTQDSSILGRINTDATAAAALGTHTVSV